jgi:hypothetical protein
MDFHPRRRCLEPARQQVGRHGCDWGSFQGISVALSRDGNTAIVGGSQDNSSIGAAWIFTRRGGVWTQQGSKLVGTYVVGDSSQGISVSLCRAPWSIGGVDRLPSKFFREHTFQLRWFDPFRLNLWGRDNTAAGHYDPATSPT